jgi:hypothetical protein
MISKFDENVVQFKTIVKRTMYASTDEELFLNHTNNCVVKQWKESINRMHKL